MVEREREKEEGEGDRGEGVKIEGEIWEKREREIKGRK